MAFALAPPVSMASSSTGLTVDFVTPNSGSLAGGQLVAVHGSGLQVDSADPLTPATVVTIGGQPCDIERVMSSGTRVVCRTRPYWSYPGLASAAGLDGTGSYYPGWPDPGCLSSRLPVVVTVLGPTATPRRRPTTTARRR